MKTDDFSERLAWARQQARYDSPRKAAADFGWNENTYKSHENGMRGKEAPPQDTVRKYARAFRVDFLWLLTGEGSSARRNIVPLAGYVGAGAEITVSDQSEGLEEIEVQWSLKEPMVAFEVVGTSMVPVYRPGFAIICYQEGRDPNSMLGEEVVVKLADGRRFLKRLRRGSRRRRYTLESFNALEPIEDVAVDWVGAIHVIVPPREFHKIRRMR
jgi:phage repressor protein C with HTH and peptisase S24 domain